MPKFEFGPKIGILASMKNQELSVIQNAAKLKITGVELHDNLGAGDPSRPWKLPDKSHRKHIKEVVESNGMTITALRCSDIFVPANMNAMKLAKYRLDLAQDIGCGIVRIDIGPAENKSMTVGKQWIDTLDMIKEYVLMAQDYDITLAMHNHGWMTVMDRVYLIQQLDSPPNLKLQLDVTNAHNNNENIFDVTREAKDYLSTSMHIKDHKKIRDEDLPPGTQDWNVTHWGHTDHSHNKLPVPMGDGDVIDWVAYVKLLNEINWDGWMTIENLREVEKSVTYLRSIGVK